MFSSISKQLQTQGRARVKVLRELLASQVELTKLRVEDKLVRTALWVRGVTPARAAAEVAVVAQGVPAAEVPAIVAVTEQA